MKGQASSQTRSLPEVVSREQWLAARKELLAREKAFTKQKDALNADRRRLPMVRIEKDYRFQGPRGTVGLPDLFEGLSQLIVQHFMFDPKWDRGCPHCSAAADEISSALLSHLRVRSTTFAVVSRAPLARIEAYKASRGWTFPWYSSYGSDFNYDFDVTIDESVRPLQLNYRSRAELLATRPAAWAWVLEAEQIAGAYAMLDMTALGRQEDWEEPKGRTGKPLPAVPAFERSDT